MNTTAGAHRHAVRMPDVSRRLLGDQIKERILEGILQGQYPPDSRLIELQIARELGTSQAPVREALRGLEALGVVELLPFRGARVRRPSTTEILEAYAVRSELESLAARLAVSRMTDEDVDELAGHVVAMQEAAAADDPHGVATADAAFHGRIVSLGGNAILERAWRRLEPFSRTLITLVMPGADPVWSASLHVPILAAFRARDEEQAVAELRHHFDEAERMAARLWTMSERVTTNQAATGNASPRPAVAARAPNAPAPPGDESPPPAASTPSGESRSTDEGS